MCGCGCVYKHTFSVCFKTNGKKSIKDTSRYYQWISKVENLEGKEKAVKNFTFHFIYLKSLNLLQ